MRPRKRRVTHRGKVEGRSHSRGIQIRNTSGLIAGDTVGSKTIRAVRYRSVSFCGSTSRNRYFVPEVVVWGYVLVRAGRDAPSSRFSSARLALETVVSVAASECRIDHGQQGHCYDQCESRFVHWCHETSCTKIRYTTKKQKSLSKWHSLKVYLKIT